MIRQWNDSIWQSMQNINVKTVYLVYLISPELYIIMYLIYVMFIHRVLHTLQQQNLRSFRHTDKLSISKVKHWRVHYLRSPFLIYLLRC